MGIGGGDVHGLAEVGLRVAGVGRKVPVDHGEDVRGPVFTNPASPELR